MNNKTIFITGGAGFIASHIVERLLEENKVIIYDNYTRNSICYDNITDNKNLTVIKGNVLDFNHLVESSKKADVIIHCAAIAGIYSVVNNPTKTMKVNLIGTYNVLEAAVKNKIERIIDFSTSEVYGPFVYRGKETDDTIVGAVGEKRWVYAISKLASEHLANTYSEEYGIKITSVRPFNVYGPRQTGEGAIQQMVFNALNNDDIVVYNDGVQIRAWCYVSDFIDAIFKILDTKKSHDQIFNIGNPQATTTIYGLALKIVEMTNSKSKIVFEKHPGAEIEIRIPDIEKAQKLLKYNPQVGLHEGLQKTIDWFKQNG